MEVEIEWKVELVYPEECGKGRKEGRCDSRLDTKAWGHFTTSYIITGGKQKLLTSLE